MINYEAARESVQLIVDDFYRTVFNYKGQLYPGFLEGHAEQCTEKLKRYISQFPVEDHKEMLEFTWKIRKETEDECRDHPIRLRTRLGTARGNGSGATGYQRQGLGELAVRTAVRATVWETIFSIFRR